MTGGIWPPDGGGVQTPAPVRFQTVAEFARAYVPLKYVVEPIIRSQSVYTLTASTGAGKTAIGVILAFAVATGRRDIINMEVEHGRVAYLAFENCDDVRMRIMVAAYMLGIDMDELGSMFVVLDARAKPEELVATLREMSHLGDFTLIIIDTFAAAFDGADVNDNVASGEFVRRLRPLSLLPGFPAVVIPAHPVKNASQDNLVPYGGGAILNEVDGNLCLVKRSDTGNSVLHWQGKFRGLEFQPINFRFEMVGSPDVIDHKGRQVVLPVMRPCTQEDVEAREEQAVDLDRRILEELAKEPRPSEREIGMTIGKSRTAVVARLKRMARDKLVEQMVGKWHLTGKGKSALNK